MMERERRAFGIGQVEVRVANEGEDGATKLVGDAALFNTWSGDLGGFKERIAPGAFTEALKDSDVRALFNHSPDQVLGRESAGTLELEETDDALRYTVDLPETTFGKDIAVSVARGDVQGNSFTFMIGEDGDVWEAPGDDGLAQRTVTKVAELFDVGPVTFPAYDATTVATRSADKAKEAAQPVRLPDIKRRLGQMDKALRLDALRVMR